VVPLPHRAESRPGSAPTTGASGHAPDVSRLAAAACVLATTASRNRIDHAMIEGALEVAAPERMRKIVQPASGFDFARACLGMCLYNARLAAAGPPRT